MVLQSWRASGAGRCLLPWDAHNLATSSRRVHCGRLRYQRSVALDNEWWLAISAEVGWTDNQTLVASPDGSIVAGFGVSPACGAPWDDE